MDKQSLDEQMCRLKKKVAKNIEILNVISKVGRNSYLPASINCQENVQDCVNEDYAKPYRESFCTEILLSVY